MLNTSPNYYTNPPKQSPLTTQNNQENLLVQSSKADKLTVMSRIEICLLPFKPHRSKNVSRHILQKLIKIWHSNSNFVPDKSNSLIPSNRNSKQHGNLSNKKAKSGPREATITHP